MPLVRRHGAEDRNLLNIVKRGRRESPFRVLKQGGDMNPLPWSVNSNAASSVY